MIKLTDIVYYGNGFVATFDDNSVANAQFKVINGKLTVIGLNPKQETAMDVFNTSIDTSDARFQGSPAAIKEVASPDAPWLPPAIPGTLLWIDPDDASTWAGVGIIADKVSGASFVNSGSAVTRSQITDTVGGALGNGKHFIHADLAGDYDSANFEHAPGGSPLNDTAVGGVGEEWLWYCVLWNNGGSSWQRGPSAYRGINGASPAIVGGIYDVGTPAWSYVRPIIYHEWIAATSDLLGATAAFSSSPPWIDPTGAVVAYYLQSYNDSGTMKIRLGFNGGTSWAIDWTHGATAATPDPAYNKWTLRLQNWQGSNPMALGETGFVRGSVSDADIATLHTYLKAKWDLTDS